MVISPSRIASVWFVGGLFFLSPFFLFFFLVVFFPSVALAAVALFFAGTEDTF